MLVKQSNPSVEILFLVRGEQNKSGQILLIQDKEKVETNHHTLTRVIEKTGI